MMDAALYLILTGLKISIFIALLVLVYLVDMVSISKKNTKHTHGLKVMAVAFILMAIVEFVHTLAMTHEGISTWLAIHENLHSITHSLALIAGLGLIWYFITIKRNIKDYR